MRLVLDTNAPVSGLLWRGNPGKLIDAAHAGSVTLYASAPLLAELRGVLEREKFTRHLQARGLNATQIFEGYAALTTVVVPAIISAIILNHPMTTPSLRAPLQRKSIWWSPGIRICGSWDSTMASGSSRRPWRWSILASECRDGEVQYSEGI